MAVTTVAVEAEASPVEAVDLVAVSVEDWARFSVWEAWVLLPLQSLTTTVVDDNLRGGILGIFQSTTSLGIILSTAIAGLIFAIAPTAPYWLGAALTFLLLLPVFYLRRVPAIAQTIPRPDAVQT